MPEGKMESIPTKTTPLIFFVNGEAVIEENVNPEWTLLTYLREKLGLKGTKLGCAEGGCGACTVMLQFYDRKQKKILNFAKNACLTPICIVHGAHVITVEGIGSVETGLHPVQERIAMSHGSQCGFCTPGIVMSMYTLLRNNPLPTMDDMEVALQGNLCRCTGYRPIIEGYRTLTVDGSGKEKEQNEGCCGGMKAKEGGCCMMQTGEGEGLIKLFDASKFKPYDSQSELIFPSELQLSAKYDEQVLVFKGERVTWYRPLQLNQLLALKAKYPDAKLVVGNTEIGLEVKFKGCLYPVIIQPSRIIEFYNTIVEPRGVRFGAAVRVSQIEDFLKDQISILPKVKTKVFQAIVEMLRWFGGKQIRNAASMAGNIITASPISDLNALFVAAHIEVVIQSKDSSRVVKMDNNFFTGYRKNILKPEEVITSILLPYTHEDEYFYGFKQSKRRGDDMAIVNAGMCVSFEMGTDIITSMDLAFGGMAATTVMAPLTQASVIGMKWNEEMFNLACENLIKDLPLDPSVPGGMMEFRRSLTLSFFFKFYLLVQNELSQRMTTVPPLKIRDKSAIQTPQRIPPAGVQLCQIVPPGQPTDDLVGRSVPHASALKQAAGEAVYIDDMPKFENELHLALVLSSKAHAKILGIDAKKALAMEGVIDFISAKDIPRDRNKVGSVVHDETVFAVDEVTCVGHVVGAIIAEDKATAQEAARAVKMLYEDLPAIITIQEAISKQSFYDGYTKQITNGDLKKGFADADTILEGEMHLGGQEHFYLETQAAIALPKLEDGEMELFCSTQNPSEIQLLAAEVMGIQENKIVVRTKRMGGGFGGKETRGCLVALPCAVAAQKLKRPVRCMLDRDEDMTCTGHRHPFYCKYKVGFKSDGKLTALSLHMFNNGGNSLDLSASVMERAVFSADNAYNIPNVDFYGRECKTNLPSNTAFRGFGGPQGMIFTEYVMDQIADNLKMDPVKLRTLNMYHEGDLTHYNQPLVHCTLRRCWDECLAKANYQDRLQQVEIYNRANRWRKRGIAVVPTKFGISYTALFMNQAGALVQVYRDGSVLLSHGGTEMGQGLHTKMIQVATRALGGVSGDKIHVMETATDKVPNTSPTAASASSDLNGMAVLNACTVIKERLEPYKKKNPQGTWEAWVSAAYMDRCGLSAAGFYRTPGIGYDFDTKKGYPFNYFSFGAGCAEVEIDCLTGDHEVKRVDIVMDVGESLNPGLDIGQIEGAYMQGYGLYTLEQLQISPDGVLLTKGPGQYKIPGFWDIPHRFNVSILRGAPNPKAVYSSKAIGEPPLFLASSVFFALRHAIKSARKEFELSEVFELDAPATAERIRMSCQDKITKNFPPAPKNTFKPWTVLA